MTLLASTVTELSLVVELPEFSFRKVGNFIGTDSFFVFTNIPAYLLSSLFPIKPATGSAFCKLGLSQTRLFVGVACGQTRVIKFIAETYPTNSCSFGDMAS